MRRRLDVAAELAGALISRRARASVVHFDDVTDGVFTRLRGDQAADRLFYTASALADHSLLWHAIGAARGLRSQRDLVAAARLSALLGVESAIVNLGVKSLFLRARPVAEAPRPFGLRQPLTSSFPSGHASAAFCAAVLLAEDDPLAPVYFALASVVAASRIHVRIHHGSDVAVGALLGLAMGVAFRRLVPLDSLPGARPAPPAPDTPAQPA